HQPLHLCERHFRCGGDELCLHHGAYAHQPLPSAACCSTYARNRSVTVMMPSSVLWSRTTGRQPNFFWRKICPASSTDVVPRTVTTSVVMTSRTRSVSSR